MNKDSKIIEFAHESGGDSFQHIAAMSGISDYTRVPSKGYLGAKEEAEVRQITRQGPLCLPLKYDKYIKDILFANN